MLYYILWCRYCCNACCRYFYFLLYNNILLLLYSILSLHHRALYTPPCLQYPVGWSIYRGTLFLYIFRVIYYYFYFTTVCFGDKFRPAVRQECISPKCSHSVLTFWMPRKRWVAWPNIRYMTCVAHRYIFIISFLKILFFLRSLFTAL